MYGIELLVCLNFSNLSMSQELKKIENIWVGEFSCSFSDYDFEIGMKDGQKITFHGEGDQEPGLEPGDIIIVLDQKDHSVFTRQVL